MFLFYMKSDRKTNETIKQIKEQRKPNETWKIDGRNELKKNWRNQIYTKKEYLAKKRKKLMETKKTNKESEEIRKNEKKKPKKWA